MSFGAAQHEVPLLCWCCTGLPHLRCWSAYLHNASLSCRNPCKISFEIPAIHKFGNVRTEVDSITVFVQKNIIFAARKIWAKWFTFLYSVSRDRESTTAWLEALTSHINSKQTWRSLKTFVFPTSSPGTGAFVGLRHFLRWPSINIPGPSKTWQVLLPNWTETSSRWKIARVQDCMRQIVLYFLNVQQCEYSLISDLQ